MGVTTRLRSLLTPIGWAYGAAITLRNFLYDSGVFSISAIDTPVISVGNITTGGTGKTPLVEHLAARLIGMGLTPAFLSRGYGRNTSGTLIVSDGAAVSGTPDRAGDEAVQVARKFPGCAVVVDERRVRGARLIESTFHPDVILLDDGFQHRALHRDLDIVVLDDGRDAARMRMLPAGDRREPMGALRRAGLVIVNRRDRGGRTPPAGSPGGDSGPVVMSQRLKRFVEWRTGTDVPSGAVRDGVSVAFCGIGSPGAFRRTLLDNGVSPAEFIVFGDHHRFTSSDIARIGESCVRQGAGYLLTTEKDAVRLGDRLNIPDRITSPLVVAEIEAVIEEGAGRVEGALAAAVRRGA